MSFYYELWGGGRGRQGAREGEERCGGRNVEKRREKRESGERRDEKRDETESRKGDKRKILKRERTLQLLAPQLRLVSDCFFPAEARHSLQ